MKKIVLILLFALSVCTWAFTQSGLESISWHVSANGNDAAPGTPDQPLKTLSRAMFIAENSGIRRITVIGTLDVTSEGLNEQLTVFVLAVQLKMSEILISGKPNATGAERAVLSGIGSGKGVVQINALIRFEHIEISGAEGQNNFGMLINFGSQVTLGAGAVVRNNGPGIGILNSICVIDGGEIRDNNSSGVILAEQSILTMRNGTIRGNNSPSSAGGVMVNNGCTFTMTGGTITANRAAQFGGGVAVVTGGRFDQSGGTISDNTAGQSPNIFRQQGALGSNL